MYEKLYDAWKLELENNDLKKLEAEFYSNIAEYMKRLREDSRMLERRAIKTSLLNKEMQNAKRMISQLIRTRYRKTFQRLAKGEDLPQEFLAPEEKNIFSIASPFADAVKSFARDVIRGQLPAVRTNVIKGRAALRFLKEVPAIIGADMKTYGPFKVEDIAALPIENSKIFVKQGLAEKLET